MPGSPNVASNPSFVYRGVTAFLHHVKEKSRLEDPGAPSDSGSLGAWAVWGFLAADLFLQHLLCVRLIPETHFPRLEAGAGQGALWSGVIAASRKCLMVFIYL